MSVRHSKIIHISGIKQRKLLCIHHFSRQDIKCSIVNLFGQKCIFFVVLSPLQCDKSGFVLSHDVSTFDHFLVI